MPPLNKVSKTGRKTLATQIRRGVLWNVINLFVTRFLSVSVRLVLARVIVPHDFGIVAIMIAAIGLVMVFVDLGLKHALIQRPRDRDFLIRFDSAFWLLAAVGIVTTLVFSFLAMPLIARLYGEPVMMTVGYAMSWSILFQSLSIIPLVRLLRRLRYRSVVIAEVISMVVSSALALALAYAGAGVWSLVAQQLLLFASKTAILWYLCRWRPRARFSVRALKDIVPFGVSAYGVKITQYLRVRSDTFTVGFILGSSALGLYTMAHLLTEVVRAALAAVVGKILLPAMSKVQGDDHEVARIFCGATRSISLLVFPVSIALHLHADSVVRQLFNSEWYGMIAPARILAWSGIVYAAGGPIEQLFQATGRPKILFQLYATNFVLVTLPTIILLTKFHGLSGTAYAVVIGMIVLRARMQWSIFRHYPGVSKGMISAVKPAILIASLCFVLNPILGETVHVFIKISIYFFLFYSLVAYSLRVHLPRITAKR